MSTEIFPSAPSEEIPEPTTHISIDTLRHWRDSGLLDSRSDLRAYVVQAGLLEETFTSGGQSDIITPDYQRQWRRS